MIQLYRECRNMGLFRTLFVTGVVILLFSFLFLQTARFPNVFYVSGGYFLLITAIHLQRADRRFLKINFNHPSLVYFTEYFLASAILLIFLLLQGYWRLTGGFLLALILLVWVDLQPGRMNHTNPVLKWIPDRAFEWKSGFRSFFLPVAIIWVSGLIFSFFVGTVPIALILLGILFTGMVERSEPLPMLLAFEESAGKLLFRKVSWSLAIYLILSVPLTFAFIIFHPARWYIPAIILALVCLLLVYTILVKYAFYEPGDKSPAGQIFVGLGMVGLIVPVLAPLVAIMSVYFYVKASKKLNFFLHDYN